MRFDVLTNGNYMMYALLHYDNPHCVDIKEYFPNSRINMINKAGHWLHADQPKEFLRICTEFLID